MRPGIEDDFARSCYAAPDRIVVATALSDLEYLAPEAIAHAEAARAELVFLHAIAPDAPPANATYYNPFKADRDARLTLEVLSRHIRARNISCSTAVRHGRPAAVVEDFLREKPSGRLMIGMRANCEGDSGRLGTTAGEILMQTPIPVCALPAHKAEASNAKGAAGRAQAGEWHGSSEKPRAILYPVGEQGPHPEGVRFALDLAQYFHAELILLQISKRAVGRTEPKSISCSAGLWPRMRRIGGTDASAPALLQAVRETGAGMMLVEAPPSLTGSTTVPATLAELMAYAPCPVLTFPVLPWNQNHPELHVLSGVQSNFPATASSEAH